LPGLNSRRAGTIERACKSHPFLWSDPAPTQPQAGATPTLGFRTKCGSTASYGLV